MTLRFRAVRTAYQAFELGNTLITAKARRKRKESKTHFYHLAFPESLDYAMQSSRSNTLNIVDFFKFMSAEKDRYF